jgi:hypothetical protein
VIAELVLGGGPSGSRQEGVPGIAAVERGGVRAHRGDRAGEMFEEDSGEGAVMRPPRSRIDSMTSSLGSSR